MPPAPSSATTSNAPNLRPITARDATTNTFSLSRVYPGVASEAVGNLLAKAEAERDDRERLGMLFDTHHARLYRLARRLTKSPEDARDLVQDAFLRAARSPGSIPESETSQEAWLVRVLVNLCRDQWRRRTTRRQFEVRYASDRASEKSQALEASVVAHATIWQVLQQLDPRRRAVIVLCELEDMPAPDVARLLGVTAITVRWHLSRGRKELARAISRPERGQS